MKNVLLITLFAFCSLSLAAQAGQKQKGKAVKSSTTKKQSTLSPARASMDSTARNSASNPRTVIAGRVTDSSAYNATRRASETRQTNNAAETALDGRGRTRIDNNVRPQGGSPTIITSRNINSSNSSRGVNTTGTGSVGTGNQTGTYSSGTSASGDVTLPRTSTPGSTISSSSTNVIGNGTGSGAVVSSASGGTVVIGTGTGTTALGANTTGAAGSANSSAAGTLHGNGISASATGGGSVVAEPPGTLPDGGIGSFSPGRGSPVSVPATIASTFRTAIPGATDVVWANSNGTWTATYRTGTRSAISSYNANGTPISTRTDIALTDANIPSAIDVYRTHNTGVQIEKITRIDLPGTSERYELITRDGRTITINNNGTPVR